MIFDTRAPVTLHTLLGNHPNTKALKSGQVSSPLVRFDYFEVKVANTQFKALVRDLKYDFGELAIVTCLQAVVYGKPYVLLPATIVGRSQHHTICFEDPLRFGISMLRASLEQIVAYARSQRLIPRAFTADELFAPAARILGDAAT